MAGSPLSFPAVCQLLLEYGRANRLLLLERCVTGEERTARERMTTASFAVRTVITRCQQIYTSVDTYLWQFSSLLRLDHLSALVLSASTIDRAKLCTSEVRGKSAATCGGVTVTL